MTQPETLPLAKMPEAFRKKPVTIQAIQFVMLCKSGKSNYPAIVEWITSHGGKCFVREPHQIIIETLESNHHVCSIGDWIIQGVKGEFYACKPDIFAATYEAPAPDKPETQAVAGSSVCPICGKDSPHYHGSEEQEARNSIVRAITDQHLLCIRLADALRGMPFPPHMPDEAGNAMRGALDEFDKKSAAYLQAALASPRSPVESAPALAPFEKLRDEIREEAKAYWRDGDLVGRDILHQLADRLSAVVEEVRGK